MSLIRVPTALRSYTEGVESVSVEAGTVGEALEQLATQFPGLGPHLFNEAGQLRPYVNLFLNDQDVRALDGHQTVISREDKLMILPSIAGGQLETMDHRAMQTSRAIRLGLLIAAFVFNQTWLVAVMAILMLVGTALRRQDFGIVYRVLRGVNLLAPDLIRSAARATDRGSRRTGVWLGLRGIAPRPAPATVVDHRSSHYHV